MKIYTKTGDSGTTGVFAGPRVSKAHPRICAYGAVDELNAVLGLVAAECEPVEADSEPRLGGTFSVDLSSSIQTIQSDLFSIGAQLATPEAEKHDMCLLQATRVDDLEQTMDELEAELTPLTNFILPGGCRLAAQLHLARTICRRVEREVVGFSREEPGAELVVVYLNRLSDLLFLWARKANVAAGVQDVAWSGK